MDFLKVSDMTTLPRPSDSQQDSSFGHPHAITPYAANGVLGCYYYHPFTNAQLKELERQAMIYKYMIASVPVPFDLLVSSPCGNKNMAGGDLEPGRCRRTDGKKWRCSKEVVPNHKYCERHLHRGRPRSRKHVEPPYSRPLKEPKEISKSISNYRESRGSETLPALAITEQENKYLNFIDIWSEKQSTTPTTPVSSSNANLSLHSLDLSMGGNNLMGLAVTGYGPYGITSSLEEMSSWLAPAPSATPGGPLAEILWPNPSLPFSPDTESSPSRAIKKMTTSVSDQSSQM